MTDLDPRLLAAIEVFRDLGWDGADRALAATLPLGSPAQQRIAKAGLAKGEWSEWVRRGNSTSRESLIPVDAAMLGAFALRLGVPARRAVDVFPVTFPWTRQGEVLTACGPATVAAFAKQRRALRLSSPPIVIAVNALGIDIPTAEEYLRRWAHLAESAISGTTERSPEFVLPVEVMRARFAEHLRLVLATGVQPSGRWERIVAYGVRDELISRDEARDLVLQAMESATRPGDRKIWAAVLMDDLQTPDAFVREHAGTVVSVMSVADDTVITRFAPTLLAARDDDLTLQVLLIGLGAKSAKAKATVLAAALAEPQPGPDFAAMIGESVAPLVGHKDKKVATLARRLLDEWQLEAEPDPDEGPAPVRGLWRPTPPLADVPRFDAGPADAENLTALTSTLLARRPEPVTLDVERFLSIVAAVAFRDPEAARAALRGVRSTWFAGLRGVAGWRDGTDVNGADRSGYQSATPLQAREAALFLRLGDVPVLLSTPSWDDFRVDPADLASRLSAYRAADAPALEADLRLALSRLDVSDLTDALGAELEATEVPIALQDGSVVPRTTGELLADWLAAVPEHPGVDRENTPLPLPAHPAFRDLPDRPTARRNEIAEWPTWPEATPGWNAPETAAVRSRPNGVAPSSQLLSGVGEGRVDLETPIAAWEAGVLLPGVASADRLQRAGTIPNIAARVVAWEELANAGLLSAVWPLVADVIAITGAGTRVAPGTAEAVELLERMLPEVRAAIDAGLASEDALALPGVRLLAARRGSSNAVVAAKSLVAQLPEVVVPEPAPRAALSEEEFAAAWPTIADPVAAADGATVAVEIDRAAKSFQARITLSDGSRHTYEGRWVWGLPHEGVAMVGPNTYLRFDGDRLIASEGHDGPATPLSESLVRVLVTMLQTPDAYHFYTFAGAISRGQVGATAIGSALTDLLPVDGFDPHRIVRLLPRYPETLPGLYPVLTGAIRYASTLSGTPPRWLVRIIDVATEFALPLREAAARGLLPAEHAAWPGLADLAASSPSAAVKRKAAALRDLLGV
ncbi:DUF7824 domain-containing protein [Microbacterium gorillae]|uniref:DUF7824 domain-containing protein n=1 Tax=Microbacterium gorillae TaxID=1231063 RepID=UPI0005901442|nr:DUF6493 family protein [Microbacterium gorillae]